jgi:hypothetical protein
MHDGTTPAPLQLLYDRDRAMYWAAEDVPFTSRTTTLNEELGQVRGAGWGGRPHGPLLHCRVERSKLTSLSRLGSWGSGGCSRAVACPLGHEPNTLQP